MAPIRHLGLIALLVCGFVYLIVAAGSLWGSLALAFAAVVYFAVYFFVVRRAP
jgi:hypothetical protein